MCFDRVPEVVEAAREDPDVLAVELELLATGREALGDAALCEVVVHRDPAHVAAKCVHCVHNQHQAPPHRTPHLFGSSEPKVLQVTT